MRAAMIRPAVVSSVTRSCERLANVRGVLLIYCWSQAATSTQDAVILQASWCGLPSPHATPPHCHGRDLNQQRSHLARANGGVVLRRDPNIDQQMSTEC